MILSFRVVLSLEDKAPPEAVTLFNPAFPNGAGLLTAPAGARAAAWRPWRWTHRPHARVAQRG
jgi:hypothetical protein